MSDIAIRVENLGKQYHIGALQQNDGHYTYKSLRDAIASAASAPFRAARALVGPRARAAASSRTTPSGRSKMSPSTSSRARSSASSAATAPAKAPCSSCSPASPSPPPAASRFAAASAPCSKSAPASTPSSTGRENVFLNGAILGMKRAEIARNFDDIVAFAEVEQFIDTPVKHYSSGMYLRLAFAVAAHLQTEILIVDEVLAVGDAEFQKKCLGKMEDVSHGGRTVLFVSHNLAVNHFAAVHFCSKAAHS